MFYDQFKKLCDERGEKPTPVAKSLGCSSSNVAMWKKGSVPRTAVLNKVADYFGVTTQYLLFGEETKNTPAVSGEGSLSYVDMATKRIWSPAPVSILVAQYGVPSAVLQEIAGCSLPEAERMAIGALPADAAQLSRIAGVFQVPLDDLIRGFVPLYANPHVAADIALRMSARFPTLADR